LGIAAHEKRAALVDLLLQRGANTELIEDEKLRAYVEARKKEIQSKLMCILLIIYIPFRYSEEGHAN
jgi:hypothetical protein